MLFARAVFYLLLALQCAGIALSCWVYVEAARPDPGSQMVLMAIPLIGAPLLGIAGLTVWIGSWASLNFKTSERRVAVVLAIISAAPMLVMMVVSVLDAIWFQISARIM